MRATQSILPLAAALCLCVQSAQAAAQENCGELVTIRSHGNTTTAYSIFTPPPSNFGEARMALVLLPGTPATLPSTPRAARAS